MLRGGSHIASDTRSKNSPCDCYQEMKAKSRTKASGIKTSSCEARDSIALANFKLPFNAI
ncbi:hypothetical protein M8C21_002353 [Ambrosia artemisiifolia]|uniref:Uncharacterized protein n=1 Tax=Ambrosia artemisiifolia TaxID=4212 RepID=A0AAD5DC91_AMBAR|nr:hypothetical protein M8C21_002353 [Ambrosia artemisiifolia]